MKQSELVLSKSSNLAKQVWFIKSSNNTPIYKDFNNAEYLISGHTLSSEDYYLTYKEMFDNFGIEEGGFLTIGLPVEETKGELVLYVRIK